MLFVSHAHFLKSYFSVHQYMEVSPFFMCEFVQKSDYVQA